MNKLIFAMLLSVASVAHADTKNLSCDIIIEGNKQKTIQMELHLDPKVMSGQVNGRTVSIANFGDIYTVDDVAASGGYHFYLNRSTLEITKGISFMEGLGFIPDNFVGKCSITKTNNVI